MSLADVRTIAAKDLWVALHRRATVGTIALFPLIAGVGLGIVVRYIVHRAENIPADVLTGLLDSFLFFSVIGAATIPTGIAAYSLVGEKVERSLEPLLATPVSDGDILVGKFLAAWLPSIGATWVGMAVFMTLADLQTRDLLSGAYFPTGPSMLTAFVVVPLAAALGVAISVLVSARANDVRTAQQIGALPALPFAALYVTSEVGGIDLDTETMLWVCAVLVVLVAGLLWAARAMFNREDILTRWR
ncbi:ABC transporter permease subunit [Actinotalea sp. M2MS4P-6]|uniref:ABC transporter permease n=1 Tax=Actinotalea sp. M2MS4P-6 TaxID=2983762 RepID=UPI0021E36D47|nr:ABC transporter permease subunit [Actinotalea sp. M2MS4P-6]MCV2394936.1 ABC transporter permease subunit [Actinotalea sp. M2MS4P-6]